MTFLKDNFLAWMIFYQHLQSLLGAVKFNKLIVPNLRKKANGQLTNENLATHSTSTIRETEVTILETKHSSITVASLLQLGTLSNAEISIDLISHFSAVVILIPMRGLRRVGF